MMLFVHVLADIIHLVKIIVLCDMFFIFQRRKCKYKSMLFTMAGLVMSAISIFIYLNNNHIFETVVYIVAIIAMIYLMYEEKFFSIVIVVGWMILALSMIDTMVSVLVERSLDLFKINGEIVVNLCVSLISLLLVYIVGRMYKKNITKGLKTLGVGNLILLTILMAVDTYVVTVIAIMNVEINSEVYRNLYLVAVVFVIMGIFIQLAAVIIFFTQRNVYKEKEAITDKYLNEQKNHYEYLENREKETKKFRHDLRSHMEVISNMANNHEYERMNSYLEKMHMKIDTFGNIVTVQNGIVDAIINQYYAKAEQSNVKMEVKGRFPADCMIDAYDLCTIFSNILSNAFEAAIETEEKFISVECRYTDTNIIIAVRNSYNSERNNGSSQWKTQKEDTDYHGYGLENIRDSVDKYHGVFDIETKDNMFILTILFNNTGK